MKGMEMPADKYQAEGDCDTLMKAEEIKADRKRLGAALTVAGERNNTMKKMMMATSPMSKKMPAEHEGH